MRIEFARALGCGLVPLHFTAADKICCEEDGKSIGAQQWLNHRESLMAGLAIQLEAILYTTH